jgi:acetyltransferase-like isoleucine patch superfamily enzyme
MKTVVKRLARALALVVVGPRLVSFAVRARILGRDQALADSMQALSRTPGLRGRYLRSAFLSRTLSGCSESVTIEHGTLLSQAGATFGEHAYVGPHCVLGWVHVERDVLIASGVCIPSGPETHGTSRLDVPIRLQPGHLRPVRIGEGAWIGANAVVMADVGRGTIVAAGAVVVTALPENVFAAGVPARVIKPRSAPDTSGTKHEA